MADIESVHVVLFKENFPVAAVELKLTVILPDTLVGLLYPSWAWIVYLFELVPAVIFGA